MAIGDWLFGLLFGWYFPVLVPAKVAFKRTRRPRSRIWGLVVVFLILLLAGGVSAHSYEAFSNAGVLTASFSNGSAEKAEARSVVAAGFGYQTDGTSTILIKTYDPETGLVLTEDSYELDVKEEGTPTSTQPRERIFAGGIGVGTNGLSQFLLRVYDASTGKFLWEGQLNLAPGPGNHVARASCLPVQRHATVWRLSMRQPASPVQPYFLVRARDPLTGSLLWQDQFAAGGNTNERIERLAYDFSRTPASLPIAPHTFDFMIRTYDNADGSLLWQDVFAPLTGMEDGEKEEQDDKANALPLWPGFEKESSEVVLIRY